MTKYMDMVKTDKDRTGFSLIPEYLDTLTFDKFLKLQDYVYREYESRLVIEADSIFYLAKKIKELENKK